MDNILRASVAEFIGTFALIFMGAGSIIMDAYTGGGVGLVGIALAHGFVLAIVVTATMNISGGHINPAVTIGLLLTGRTDAKTAIFYIPAQLAGAVVAGFALKALYPGAAAAAVSLGTPVLAEGISFGRGIAIEALLTFMLMFAIFGTAVDPRAPKVGGFGIGLVLIFAILAGGPLTGASLNPARTFGPALAAGVWSNHLVYWIGPIVGAGTAAVLYTTLFMGTTPASEES